MGLDPLDVAGKIKVELELIDVFVFVFGLCSCFCVVFADALLLSCFGYRWVNGHNTALTPENKKRGYCHISRDENPVNQNMTSVWKVLQCFHASKGLRVFGDHISQDVLHTCSYFLHWGQTWHESKMM